MSGLLLAEFSGADKLLKAARQARAAGLRAIDAFTPFVIDGLAKEIDLEIDLPRSHVRVAMFIGGVIVAALAYGTEWYSAVVDYPINSGGRPLNAWPAFMLVPFAVGILGAAVSGLITMLMQAGMPSLHHRLFEIPDFERASQDAFLLALDRPRDERGLRRARAWLRKSGARAIWEIKR
jgi:hypothetical protein